MEKPFTHFIPRRSAAILLALAAIAPLPSLPARQGSLEALANREIARRQENLVIADQLIRNGDKAAADKDYETAYVAYLDALDKIPAGGATKSERAQTLAKFTRIGLLYAEQLVANGHYSDGERVAKTILLPQYDPTCRAAVQFLSNLEQADYYNKTVTPEFAAARKRVIELLREADGFYGSGRFDLAMKRYEQVLNIDPYNIAARKGMEQVNLQKSQYYKSAYNETRSRMLWQVVDSWERPVRRFDGGLGSGGEMISRGGSSGTEAITAKLNRIIIPKIDLNNTTVREAVEFLKQRSRDLDNTTNDPKEKRGVNIVLKLADVPAPAPAADSTAAAPVEGAAAAAPVGGNANTRISLELKNVPLIEALRYLTELADLKFKIEPYAVSIVPLSENTTELVTKEYRVPPSFIPSTAAAGADGSAGVTGGAVIGAGGTNIGTKMSAQDYFTSLGIPSPPGAFAQYIAAGSRLVVRNTPDVIDVIDRLVDATSGQQPTQVEIESKFLEITQHNLEELGFDWLLGPIAIGGGTYGAGGTQGYGTNANPTAPNPANFPFVANGVPIGQNPVTGGLRSGTGIGPNSAVSANSIDALLGGALVGTAPGIFGLSGIFTNPQFQVVIRALNQKKGIDLMSAPKVTTKSGRKALVRVVREFPYPTEFNPPEVPPPVTGNSSGSSVVVGVIANTGVVTPTTPTAFETRNVGVTLEVEPIIGPDGYTIDLNLAPEVVEFEGFINYGSPILGPTYDALTDVVSTFPVTPNVINQPIFSTRKVTTSVSIWDGQTVALGGLIREDVQKTQDKVPILGDIPLVGRLFRSNVDQKIKRNLIIFVTAKLIDAEGRPIRRTADDEVPVEALGLPQPLPTPAIETIRRGK